MKNDYKKSKINSYCRSALILLTVFFTVSTVRAAVFTVTNLNDSGAGSLRQAIFDANFVSTDDMINFNLSGCPCTITLTNGQLPVFNSSASGTLTINGPGEDQLSISGGGNSSVFELNFADVTINDLTITGGKASNLGGGGIQMIFGTLTVNNSKITGNSSQDTILGGGGGIFNNGGTLTLTNTTISNNSAVNAGGGIDNRGVLNLINSTITDNSAQFRGGGIQNGGIMTVNNSTITRNSSQFGGGIENLGTSTLTDSTVSNNSATTQGGGIENQGTLTLTNTTVSGNSANGAGGILNNNTLTLNNSVVRDNTADSAAGIANVSSIFSITATLTLNNSTVSNNSAISSVGGIFNLSGTTTLLNSTVSGNSAPFGGGILNSNLGTMILTASTVSNNTAESGAGIVTSGTLSLTNSTISSNSATFIVGGVFNQFGSVNIDNTIIAGNTAPNTPDVFGPFISQGYNLIGVGDGSTGFGGVGDQVGTLGSPLDPKLGPLADNGGPTKTHALLAGSPAIDAGNSQLTTDQRGFPRPIDLPLVANVANGSDIGAVEVFYNFSGFFQPISSTGLNIAAAGSTIPIKFSLGGDFGPDIFAEGSPSSQKINCSNLTPTGNVEPITPAGSSSLSYDTLTDQYIQVWKTNKSLSGTCRRLTVRFNDGSNHSADFQFK